jgi:hypothetical protein
MTRPDAKTYANRVLTQHGGFVRERCGGRVGRVLGGNGREGKVLRLAE